jgi:hypothetical protein
MDFSVKDIQMGIKNVHNGNTIIGEIYCEYQSPFFKVFLVSFASPPHLKKFEIF